MLENMEKLEKVLFQSGNFTIKNVVLIGSKTATGTRRSHIYTKEYNSTKYTDRATLQQMTLSMNEYIDFSYSDYQNRINADVFASYPHLDSVLYFFDSILDLVYQEGFYTNNGINPAFYINGDVPYIESDPLASGKVLGFYPAMLESKDGTTLYQGGILLIDNNENIAIQLDINAIATIRKILSIFNLGIESNQLLIISMLNELGAGAVSQPQPSNGFQTQYRQPVHHTAPKQGGIPQKPKRSLNRGSSPIAKPSINASAFQTTHVEDSEDMEPQIVKDEKPSKTTSMSAIMSAASEIHVPIEEMDFE